MTRNSDAPTSKSRVLGVNSVADAKFAVELAEAVRRRAIENPPTVDEIRAEIKAFDDRQQEIWKDRIVKK